jgi:hypothetical protein
MRGNFPLWCRVRCCISYLRCPPLRFDFHLRLRPRARQDFGRPALFVAPSSSLDSPTANTNQELETALLAPTSSLLDSVRLALIKQVSSFRGITVDNFEEYTRRQYHSKGKAKANPFGDEEKPKGWYELSVEDRVRVLHQLSQWLWVHPDRVREKMKDADEKEQVQWVSFTS